ncbi:fumarylacetoacetase [Streptomyces sp. MP131-18]|uniref:fumarylacetoacetase n=1 Tax=Streptomyces sp. MP131-18 TaxID=1857892 RepID=UPI00097C398E|nr:fumarylacetoacetase [Streptomyces sp. MP131-18]ONK10142.1 fumarylacetoacetase [Streptomyces sp. MP131-18]
MTAAARHGTTWLGLDPAHPFGIHTLPYGSFTTQDTPARRVGVAIGDQVLDLTAAAEALLPGDAALFAAGTLDPLLAAGPDTWARVRAAVTDWLGDERHRTAVEPLLRPAGSVDLHLPFTVADYVDFYASEHHATALGRMFRPDGDPLTPNWKHLPIGYHGRAGTVVPSGTPVVRPTGQRRTPEGDVVLAASARLDIEAEVGFVVGTPSTPGRPVPLAGAGRHLFGVCLVNDWSARDIQAWEYVPLGPFLGKSFATSVSPWVVPLAALGHARTAPPPRDPRPLPYLDDTADPAAEPWGLDLTLRVTLNGHPVSAPPFAAMYWTAAQQLAHLTVNGASLRTGDLLASGTVSGPGPGERGSLIELTANGGSPLTLPDGSTRAFLEDGDEVVITADAPGPGGTRIGLGEVRGRIAPAVPSPS